MTDAEAEELRMVAAAVEMTKNDIECPQTSRDPYPTQDDISSLEKNSALLPESPRLLPRNRLSEKEAGVKIAAVGQAMVQTARLRVIIAHLHS